MQEVLNSLLNLQEIDEDLGELDRSKVYLPEMIQNINKEIEEFERELLENRETFNESKTRQAQLELEIKTDKTDLEKYQEQMKVIKTNKEYDALVAEIDEKKQRISDSEDEVLKLMNVIDEATEKIEELEKKLVETKASNETQLDHLRAELEALEMKINEKKKERLGVAKTVDRRALTTYERIRKGKGGLAVVPLRKRACGGCFKQIPPQMVQQIRRGDRLYTCDSCGRILIWIDED